MTRAKFIFMATLISGLWALGCSDDGSDGGSNTIACDMASDGVCFSGEGTAEECTSGGGKVVGSCDSGELAKCDLIYDGSELTVYIYDSSMANLSCQTLASLFEMEVADGTGDSENDNGSTGSTGEENNNSGATITCQIDTAGMCFVSPGTRSDCVAAGGETVAVCDSGAANECVFSVNGEESTFFIYSGSIMESYTCAELGGLLGLDDSSNSNNNTADASACYLSDYGYCVEADGVGDACAADGGAALESCPANAATECEMGVSGQMATIYIYPGSPMESLTCEALQATFDAN